VANISCKRAHFPAKWGFLRWNSLSGFWRKLRFMPQNKTVQLVRKIREVGATLFEGNWNQLTAVPLVGGGGSNRVAPPFGVPPSVGKGEIMRTGCLQTEFQTRTVPGCTWQEVNANLPVEFWSWRGYPDCSLGGLGNDCLRSVV